MNENINYALMPALIDFEVTVFVKSVNGRTNRHSGFLQKHGNVYSIKPSPYEYVDFNMSAIRTIKINDQAVQIHLRTFSYVEYRNAQRTSSEWKDNMG